MLSWPKHVLSWRKPNRGSGRVSKLVLTSSFLSVECPSAMKGGRGTSFKSCGNRVK